MKGRLRHWYKIRGYQGVMRPTMSSVGDVAAARRARRRELSRWGTFSELNHQALRSKLMDAGIERESVVGEYLDK